MGTVRIAPVMPLITGRSSPTVCVARSEQHQERTLLTGQKVTKALRIRYGYVTTLSEDNTMPCMFMQRTGPDKLPAGSTVPYRTLTGR
jgi:hypothetical protein